VHVPAANSVSELPDTVQIAVVAEVNVTAKSELAVALIEKTESPYVFEAGAMNEIVWAA
jgi:hypothetical protein